MFKNKRNNEVTDKIKQNKCIVNFYLKLQKSIFEQLPNIYDKSRTFYAVSS